MMLLLKYDANGFCLKLFEKNLYFQNKIVNSSYVNNIFIFIYLFAILPIPLTLF